MPCEYQRPHIKGINYCTKEDYCKESFYFGDLKVCKLETIVSKKRYDTKPKNDYLRVNENIQK